ncbi:lysoplasmalogenase family protein [Rhizobium glycinendophyticum]|uniref:Lysoplasmalogenase n=1 Tax=Rhizobium glycinendophyticum TaxID=2589807 RepID=A0A504TWY0_9HYPH|nr:lysoplasmalogenase family protein [Rhizobium glycinendophyticum]TPP07004.1 lysoplasmalogenase [Rhizobium glycinendophyticum]
MGSATGILALSVALGTSYLWILPREKTVVRAIWKTSPVVLLCVYAIAVGAPPLLALALFLGALGDLSLAFDGDKAFIRGVVAFLLSHLAYIALIAGVADVALAASEPWRIAGGLAVAGFTCGVLARIWRPAGRMALPIGLYVLVFMVLVWLTLGLADPLTFFGAALFIFSDVVLTIRKYWTGPGHPIDWFAAHLVWVTYYAAQVILTLTLSRL